MDFIEKLKFDHNIILNSQQEQAVMTIKGAILLLAVPGSGKTTVIITRLGNMIFNYSIPPENILNITFSRASAHDMKLRFNRIFGDSLNYRLEFRTIHSFCLMVLKDYYKNENIVIPKLIEDNFTRIKKIFIDLNQTFAGDEIIKDIVQKISYCTNMLISNEEINKVTVAGCDFPKILKLYNDFKASNNQIDFDDMLDIVYNIFKNQPKYLEKYQEMYRYINLDEAQDTSFLQHEIIRLLAQKHNNVFMVGDEDQSIYGFRAAFPKALLNFEKIYKNAIVLKMERNYRSTKNIVLMANQFIKQNKERFDKEMFCENEAGTPIKFIQLTDLNEQYDLIINKIKDEYSKKNIAIIYRNNDSAIPIVDVLEREGINFSIRENTPTFFTHFVTNDVLSFIRLAQNGSDISSFEKIYFKLNLGISKKMIDFIKQSSNRNVFDTLVRYPGLNQAIIKNIKNKKVEFINLSHKKPLEAIQYIEVKMDYNTTLLNISKQGFSHETLLQKMNTLKNVASKTKDLSSFLNRIGQLQELMSSSATGNKDITLSTVHSSKGLEFDIVILIDAIDGQFPSSESINQKNEKNNSLLYEEESRLFYVGITRARYELVIISSDMSCGQNIKKSRFIDFLQNKEKPKYPTTIDDKERTVKDLNCYKVNIDVMHKQFGKGSIVEISGITASIKFSNNRIIKFDLKRCIENDIIKIINPESQEKSKYISISEFVKKNKLPTMVYKKRIESFIIDCLLEKGYLKKMEINKKIFKIPSDNGIKLGLKMEKRQREETKEIFFITLYNEDAQLFILNSILSTSNINSNCNIEKVSIPLSNQLKNEDNNIDNESYISFPTNLISDFLNKDYKIRNNNELFETLDVKRIDTLLEVLPKKSKELVLAKYKMNKTISEICDSFNISELDALKTLKKSLKKLLRFKDVLFSESYVIEFDNRKILELSKEELTKFEFSPNRALTLTEISDRFSNIKNTNIYGKMRSRYIKSWLLENNYYENIRKGIYTSIPTKKGNQVGIVYDIILINNNEQSRILFNLQAQKFIVEHYIDIYNFTIRNRDAFMI